MIKLLPAFLLLLAGCGAELSNAVFDEDQAFIQALPHTAELRLSVAAGGAAGGVQTLTQPLAEDPSELYLVTRKTMLAIDRGVFHRLREVDRLVEAPPSVRAPGRREWGPVTHPLDPLEGRLVMLRTAPDTFEYAYEQRSARDEDAAFVAVITGRFDGAAGTRVGAGEVTFDLDASRALTGAGSRGLVHAEYDRRADGLSLTLTLTGFTEGDGQGLPADNVYFYERDSVGVGEFEFALYDKDGTLIEARSRWLVDGSGRTDARFTGAGDDGNTAEVTECWDSEFAVVDEGDCAFDDQALPERIEPPPRD